MMKRETMNYMLPFWEQRKEDLDTAAEYCDRQINSLLLKLMGQIAIPIEAAMEEERDN